MSAHGRLLDVLIVGGGPAGLLLADKLGRHLDVCVVERNQLGSTSKFWLTSDERLARHDLQSAARYRAARATLGTFQGSMAYAEGNFVAVDDTTLLRLLLERCQRAAVRLHDRTKVLSVVNERDKLVAHTTNGHYKARLVLDASGGGSPFAATFRLHRLEGFYSIYGAHLDDVQLAGPDIVGAHVVHFGYPAPLFEVIPTGPSSAFCIVFCVSTAVIDPTKLRALFLEHVAHNPFFEARHLVRDDSLKMGVIPIGRPARRRLHGILPVGEAGMVQSPLVGAAFNEVLEFGDLIAERILTEFKRDATGIVRPCVSFPAKKLVNDRIQLMLVRQLLDGTLLSFERLVHLTNVLGPTRAYRLFGTALTWTDLPTLLKAAATEHLTFRRNACAISGVAAGRG